METSIIRVTWDSLEAFRHASFLLMTTTGLGQGWGLGVGWLVTVFCTENKMCFNAGEKKPFAALFEFGTHFPGIAN